MDETTRLKILNLESALEMARLKNNCLSDIVNQQFTEIAGLQAQLEPLLLMLEEDKTRV